MFGDYIMSWLDSALDYGIEERDFWDMTIAELGRKIESIKRKYKQEQQTKASFDYILADLIGRSIARIYNSSNEMPDISAVYPTLFEAKDAETIKVEKQDNLSAARFRQFADSHNKKFREGGKGE